MGIRTIIYLLYLVEVFYVASSPSHSGMRKIEGQIKYDADQDNADTNHHTTKSNPPLQFRFDSSSNISGWWCVRMNEVTASWQDNYLCTNRDIGLSWRVHYNQCAPTLKCVYLPEIDDWVWSDNALCLPLDSNIELIYSSCGALSSMSCVQLFDPSAPGYLNDNFVCWKVHSNEK